MHPRRRPRHHYTYGEYLRYERDSLLSFLSLQEYVLVSQTHPRIERYRPLPSGDWEYRDVTAGTLQLTSGATLDMAALYADLPE